MSEIVESIEIARPPEDVFAYATDFSRFPDWQAGVVAAHPDSDGPPTLGSRATVTRQAGPQTLSRQEEITEFNPPRSWAVRGVGGPVTAIAKGAVEPLADRARSRLGIALEFEGQGIGKLLVPLVIRKQARKQLPKNLQKLKDQLERPGSG